MPRKLDEIWKGLHEQDFDPLRAGLRIAELAPVLDPRRGNREEAAQGAVRP